MAESIGLVLLLSFVAAEEYSIIKALNDLLWIPQSEEEQNEDFNQTTDSTIAIVTALLLMAIAFIGVALAKWVWNFVKSVPGRFKPKPKVGEPEPVGPKPGEPVSTNPNKLVICRKCTEVKGFPDDLMTKRGSLSDKARARLDQKAAEVFPDPENPTQAQFDAMRKFMEDMETKGDGNLEAGLQKLIDEEVAVQRANLAKAKAESRGIIEEIKKLLNKKENAKKLSGEDKQAFGERQRQLEDEWSKASESADGAKGDPELEVLALEEFENIKKKAAELESEIQEKLKGPGVVVLPDNWDAIQPDTIYTAADGRQVSFSKAQIELGKGHDARGKHIDAINKGRVPPEGATGLVPSQEPGFDLKSKVLGIGGDHRFHGRVEDGVLHFPGKMTDH